MFRNRIIVIASMHGKETIIGPSLEASLEARLIVCKDLNTDVFGTFTRETPRLGTQIEAIRMKVFQQATLNLLEKIKTSVSFAIGRVVPLLLMYPVYLVHGAVFQLKI